MKAQTDVAVIVPVLDDLEALAALLARLEAEPVAPRQIIVAAARDDARLRTLCESRGCRRLCVEPNRGLQLDRGARDADAPVLWFLHADAAPVAGALHAIEAAVSAGAESGCFRFRFEPPSTWRKRLLARLVNLRVALGGIPYGDQGIFVARDAYLACGGFAHAPLFEEVGLIRRLRSRGTFRRLPLPIDVSARRWQRDGWSRRSLRNRWLALRYSLGTPADTLAASYSRRQGTDRAPTKEAIER